MKLLSIHALGIGLLAIPGLSPANAADPAAADLLLRYHFAGMDRLLADPEAATLKKIWSLPATAGFKQQALDQLALTPWQTLSNQVPKGAAPQAELFRPLLDDLVQAESFLDWRGPAGKSTECVLAVQMSDDRARLWSANLQKALTTWKLGQVQAVPTGSGEGWILKPAGGGSSVALARAGQWLVVGWGPAPLPLHGQALQRIKAEGRPGPKPTGHWLTADASLERLKPWLPPLQPFAHPPVLHLAVSNRTDNVRTVARLEFPQGHGWKSESWLIPKDMIRGQIASFTAVQGLAPLIEQFDSFKKLGFKPQLNQAICWAQPAMPFLDYCAVPLKYAGPEMVRIAPTLPNIVLSNGPVPLAGSIAWTSNRQDILWHGFPIAQPRLSAFKDQDTEYLLASLFPLLAGTNRPPPELFRQLETRNSLAYYDWEVTGIRSKQWRAIYHLLDMASGRQHLGTNAATQRWLLGAAPLLGETVTEITVNSPTEMTLVRKSPIGFTGFELVTLGRWLDSPTFPHLSVLGPPRKPLPTGKPKPVSPATKPVQPVIKPTQPAAKPAGK